MEKLTYDSVDKALLASVPELGKRYSAEAEWQGRPGQYIVVEDVLRPFLNELLDSGKDAGLIRRVFDFLEDMARSSDIEVVNLLYVGILETLVGQPGRLGTAWKYMGEATRKVARECARTYRCEANLPSQDLA
jgi:hypothetical protein